MTHDLAGRLGKFSPFGTANVYLSVGVRERVPSPGAQPIPYLLSIVARLRQSWELQLPGGVSHTGRGGFNHLPC